MNMCSEIEKKYELVSCSLELNPFIYIDRELLGAHFCVRIRDNVYLRVNFPQCVTLDENNWHRYFLTPAGENYYKEGFWGEGYFCGNGEKLILHAVECEFFYLNDVSCDFYMIEEKILPSFNAFLKRINIVYPDAMTYHSKSEDYCDIDSGFSVLVSKKSRLKALSKTISLQSRNIVYLKRCHILNLLRRFSYSVNVTYDLLSSARNDYHRGIYRSVILNCSTIVEIILNKQLRAYLQTNVKENKIVDYIFKKLNGFNAIVEACKKVGLQLSVDSGTMKELRAMAKLRNRIIHGGYTPSEKEAKAVLDTTSKFMKLCQEEIYNS